MFAIHTGRAIAAALVLTVVPAAGYTATFDVVQQRANISNDGTGVKSVAGQISVLDGGTQQPINTTAGSFHLSKKPTGAPTSAYEDFIAFCIEVTQNIITSTGSPVTYTEDNSLFDPTRRQLISTLLGTAFDPAEDAQHHAATQLAVWKLAFGDVSASSGDAFDVTAQSFKNLPGGSFLSFVEPDVDNTFDGASSGVFTLAQGWLDKLDGAGGDDWTLLPGNRVTFLSAEGSQNLVTYTAPVPVPAAGGLMMGAIAGLAALRRRRKTA